MVMEKKSEEIKRAGEIKKLKDSLRHAILWEVKIVV